MEQREGHALHHNPKTGPDTTWALSPAPRRQRQRDTDRCISHVETGVQPEHVEQALRTGEVAKREPTPRPRHDGQVDRPPRGGLYREMP